MKFLYATLLAALASFPNHGIVCMAETPPDNCITHELTFVVKEGSSQMRAVEDDIRRDLEKIGINLETIFANSTEYDNYETSGDYNLLFATTWGAPYDPHS